MTAEATSTGPTMEGWLRKRGKINTAFKGRWMILQGGTLDYFAPEVSAHPYRYSSCPHALVCDLMRA